MHRLVGFLLWFGIALASPAGETASPPVKGRVIKVLPHFLDLKGRHTILPSLYDRDAHQARLRAHPEERSGLRFDVEWTARPQDGSALKLRIEARGVAKGQLPASIVHETSVTRKGWFSQWTGARLTKEEYEKLGDLTAWRVTLWDGDTILSEQKSFLW